MKVERKAIAFALILASTVVLGGGYAIMFYDADIRVDSSSVACTTKSGILDNLSSCLAVPENAPEAKDTITAQARETWQKSFVGRTSTGYFEEESLLLLVEAAKMGSGDAQFDLGIHLYQGQIENTIDKDLGLAWIERAAENGNVAAISYVGFAFLERHEFEKAMVWLDRAVELENVDAMVALAILFMNGAVEQDFSRAVTLLERANNAGNPLAPSYLFEIYARDTPLFNRDQALQWYNTIDFEAIEQISPEHAAQLIDLRNQL